MNNNYCYYIDDDGYIIEHNGYTELAEYGFGIENDWRRVCSELNSQLNTIKELKQTLKNYREKISCHNCTYHNYDWFSDGDEFEICEKGNNDELCLGFCKDWREFDNDNDIMPILENKLKECEHDYNNWKRIENPTISARKENAMKIQEIRIMLLYELLKEIEED